MAKEITISVFERNAKIFNKKGLRRTYSSIPSKYSEYVPFPPLGSTSKFVLEATVDKGFVSDFINLLKENGFTVLGSKNYYYLERILNDYELNKESFTNQKEAMEALTKDLELMKENNKEYDEVENDDAKFYFLPYNNDIDTLFEFIGVYKEQILEFAKSKDITIMLKPLAYMNQVDGFFGFNFYDAEKDEEEVVVDYASAITILTDFKNRYSVYASGLLLTGIGENVDELVAMNTHLIAENLKYERD